ncbi:MAG TPA: hypothetical protein VLT36_13415 [Candidatus Dormibacteraeota bacterium]|nr:hypothetical protein [Candidatus Dormibacteraeota bacterium]
MIHTTSSRLLALVLLSVCLALPAHAQFPGGGFGGFGGFGGNNNSSRSRGSTTRQYPNNGIGGATFSVDPDSGNIVIVADPETTKHIQEVIANMDQPKPQVLIKVVFLEVTRNDSTDIGIEGSYNHPIGSPFGNPLGFVTNFGIFQGSNSAPQVAPTSVTPVQTTPFLGASNIFGLQNLGSPNGLYQILGSDYQVTIRAIATAGKAKVLSRPSVIARNNQPATITVGQSVPLITNVRFDNFGNAINSVSYQSVGIILRVTPFIRGDGLVEMILSPETSELVADRSQWVPISSGPGGSVSAPLINTRSADTVVMTPDGQTIIIGGLMEDSKAESETKIPFLGDIPLLGMLFRHKIKNGAKTELIIFLTPHVIAAPTELASVTATEREHSEAAKSLSEQELNKFLDGLPTNRPPANAKSPHH